MAIDLRPSSSGRQRSAAVSPLESFWPDYSIELTIAGFPSIWVPTWRRNCLESRAIYLAGDSQGIDGPWSRIVLIAGSLSRWFNGILIARARAGLNEESCNQEGNFANGPSDDELIPQVSKDALLPQYRFHRFRRTLYYPQVSNELLPDTGSDVEFGRWRK